MYDKWRQQQKQQREQTLQQQNEYWNAKCYRQLAATDEEAERDHGEDDTGPIGGVRDDNNHHDDSGSDYSHHTIPPSIDWNNNKDNEYNAEYDDEYDAEYEEYNSDNKMYTKNDAIVNRIFEDTSYIENTTIHTTDNTNTNTITEIPTLTPTTNKIIEPFIYTGIN